MHKYSILLGGIGGDSHSVGLTILRQALQTRYRVHYLGPQTPLETFMELASISDIVMISCMDGHAEKYLREWPTMRSAFGSMHAKWYLGGNPALYGHLESERMFLQMGFDRVFTQFVDVSMVLDCIERDLHDVSPAPDPFNLWARYRSQRVATASQLSDERLEDGDFWGRRTRHLESWKTGREAISLDESAEFLRRQPSYHGAQVDRNAGKRGILVQPRVGVASVNGQIAVFEALKGAGASTLSYQVDSLTRNNNYRGAETAIEESLDTGASTLNGFPVVNHGVAALRKVITQVGLPIQTRHSTREPELLAEISYAGGVTAYEGGAICYNIPYYKDYPIDQSIKSWQYVDRLTGLYHDRYGIILDREFFGTLTATLIPPSLAISICILESLLAAQQGVKSVSVGYAEQGHRLQDIAAIRMLETMTRRYLDNAGYSDVHVNTIFHQYMAGFPPSYRRSAELIRESALTAGLSGATRLLTKTPVEANTIPTAADNAEGLRLVQKGLQLASFMQVDELGLQGECEVIRQEVQCLIEGVILAGNGLITTGVVKAFELGHLDIPFAPSIHNRGLVLTARDIDGAVRYLDPGMLPFDRDLKRFHGEKMAERARKDGYRLGRDNHRIVEADVLQVPRDNYASWPLDAGVWQHDLKPQSAVPQGILGHS